MEVVILFMTCLQKYVMSETKEVNAKVFSMITRKNEIKILMNIFHVILNAYSIAQHVIQIKNGTVITK